MQKKSRSFWNGGGPYVVFALCLATAGLLGARLFLPETGEEPVPEEPVIYGELSPAADAAAEAPLQIPLVKRPVEEAAPSVSETPVVGEASDSGEVFTSPLEGETIAVFSTDTLCYNEALADWRTHNGVDIAAESGSPVSAAAAGTVKSVIEDPLLGTTLTLTHDGGYESVYASLEKEVYVSVGDEVTAGERIGAVGATAAGESEEPHLHFSVSRDGKLLDPTPYLD